MDAHVAEIAAGILFKSGVHVRTFYRGTLGQGLEFSILLDRLKLYYSTAKEADEHEANLEAAPGR